MLVLSLLSIIILFINLFIGEIMARIKLKTSYSSNRWFDNQKQLAEWLEIKNSSKKAIESRVRKLGMEVEF